MSFAVENSGIVFNMPPVVVTSLASGCLLRCHYKRLATEGSLRRGRKWVGDFVF